MQLVAIEVQENGKERQLNAFELPIIVLLLMEIVLFHMEWHNYEVINAFEQREFGNYESTIAFDEVITAFDQREFGNYEVIIAIDDPIIVLLHMIIVLFQLMRHIFRILLLVFFIVYHNNYMERGERV